jgi:putative ABC transport system permease protein
MIRHLFKLVWNRKRPNALMILEICISFLVVFVVGTLGLFFYDNYQRPLGFSWRNVWEVQIGMGQSFSTPEGGSAEQAATFARLLQEARSLGAVEAAAGSSVAPFEMGGMSGTWSINGRDVSMDLDQVTTGFADVMGLTLVSGRWFQDMDAALGWEPVVIDQDLAREVYGSANPVGQPFGEPAPKERQRRVIGVVSEYRKNGELMPGGNFMFQFYPVGDPATRPASHLMVRVRPGTPAVFEEELVKRLQAVAPEWSFEVRPLPRMRRSMMRSFLTPLLIAGTVAFFLLLMVGLGLIGVLWQNLLQRTREIGLRRATGASQGAVHRQVVMEQLLLTSLGVLLGAILVVQIPILDLIGFLNGRVFTGGLLFAMATIYLLSALCVLYPSAIAARVPPAEALRYE